MSAQEKLLYMDARHADTIATIAKLAYMDDFLSMWGGLKTVNYFYV